MYIMLKKTENTSTILDYIRKADEEASIREYNHIISVSTYHGKICGYITTDYSYRDDIEKVYLNLYSKSNDMDLKHIDIAKEISSIQEL